MRPLDEWDLSDLQALIDGQVQEYLQLDYKASEALQNSDGKKAEIAKDVSAFANSAGGRIVYGILEDKRYPTRIDTGCDPQKITKEWIENVILSGISPRVDGVRVKEVALPSGRCAFVVDIPQASSRAPHQSKDKRYYKRYEFQSVPMEDYEVKDIMRRSSSPDLVAWYAISPTLYDDESGRLRLQLQGRIGNRSNEPALYATVRFLLKSSIGISQISAFDRSANSHRMNIGGSPREMYIFDRHINPSSHQPIYRERPVYLFSEDVFLDPRKLYAVGVELSYPGERKQRFGLVREGVTLEMSSWISIENFEVPED